MVNLASSKLGSNDGGEEDLLVDLNRSEADEVVAAAILWRALPMSLGRCRVEMLPEAAAAVVVVSALVLLS